PVLGTVVVADDDASCRQLLKGLLTGMAERVIEAENGDQALAVLAGDHADLVLADLRMPGMDGGTLLSRLPASVPAILVTSGHGARGPGPGRGGRADPARRAPARHQRLRRLPADQGRPADRGDPGDPGV